MPEILKNPFVAAAIVFVAGLYLGVVSPGPACPSSLTPMNVPTASKSSPTTA